MAEERTRNWTFIVYPESCVENWREKIDEMHIPWCSSPLHDKDINANGEPKKPHWHIVLCFDGKKSYSQIELITKSVGGTRPEKVHELRAMIRYLAHLDNPDKWQYDFNDVISYGGLDVEEISCSIKSRLTSILNDIQDYVIENDITEFADLSDYAKYTNSDWYTVITKYSTFYLKTYLSSRRNKGRNKNG